MSNTRYTRRRLLEATSGLAVLGLAGCLGTTGGGGEDPAESQTDGGGDPPGHGESEHGHDTMSEPKASREVLVNTARNQETTEYHFDPHVTWVSVGGTVKWTLESGTHTATAYHPGNDEPRLVPEGTDPWDSGTLAEEGASYEHTFDTEGIYHYYCAPHEQFGMIATVIVGEPHPDDQAALQAPPADKPEEVHGKLEELNEMCRSMLSGGGHEDDHDDGTEDGHHDDGTTEDGHHDDTTEGDHHDDTTEGGHHDDTTEGDHHDDTTEGDHHDDTTEGDHHDDTTEGDHHDDGTTTNGY
jgi:plastocyanin